MKDVDRREFLKEMAVTATAVGLGAATASNAEAQEKRMPEITLEPLRFPWQTSDPFLFCAYHLDAYPKGNAEMGPAPGLAGRHIGSDFSRRDGWSMYHGDKIPGFPRHPHRGFETVTVARKGYIDHSDSLGATARYGGGDAQWMTAGKGIVHAEMFPLRRQDKDNPLELFQIWLNLPARNKMVAPHFSMFWHETIPRHALKDAAGKGIEIVTIAGAFNGKAPPSPPPKSWAAQPGSHVRVWTIDLEPGAKWTLPAAPKGVSRSVYFYRGDTLKAAGRSISVNHRMRVQPELPLPLEAGGKRAELLLLEGQPVGEPVAHHGPFVMNTRQELQQAFRDYRRDGFGGWPWKDDAPVHKREQDRFAIHADGRRDKPKT